MECNCKWTEIVLGIVILIFSFWKVASWSEWIIIIAAVILILHALMCKNCGKCMPESSMPKKKRRR